MLVDVAFYVFAVLVLGSFLIVVSTSNILYSLSALAFGMMLVSGFFFLLDAEFLGVVQITVYTGAVIVLYAFGMMFFNLNSQVEEKYRNKPILVILMLMAVFFVTIVNVSRNLYFDKGSQHNTSDLAITLFNDYLIPFESAAIMILMAMVVGIAIGSRKSYMSSH